MKKKPAQISQKDWEEVDVPELPDEYFARMRPAHEVLPALIGEQAAAELVTQSGRPKKEQPEPGR